MGAWGMKNVYVVVLRFPRCEVRHQLFSASWYLGRSRGTSGPIVIALREKYLWHIGDVYI
jgi:hypothetical protein